VNADLRDFCIMSRFCLQAFCDQRTLMEIEAARITVLQYTKIHLSSALSSDNLDVFHRRCTVIAAARQLVSNHLYDKDILQIKCIQVLTSWIHELLPSVNIGTEIRIPMCHTHNLCDMVSCGLKAVQRWAEDSMGFRAWNGFSKTTESGATVQKAEEDEEEHGFSHIFNAKQSAVVEFVDAAFQVPDLDQSALSNLLFTKWTMLLSPTIDQFAGISTVWKESILAQANLNPTSLPYQARSFQQFISFLHSRLKHLKISEANFPFVSSFKLALELSGPLFVSVSQHETLVCHVKDTVLELIRPFCNCGHSTPASCVHQVAHETFITLHPVINGCATAIYDWFQELITSSNVCNLRDASAFCSALLFFHDVLEVTKPVDQAASKSNEIQDRVAGMITIQRDIHASFSHRVWQLLEIYIAKYYSVFAEGDENYELPHWFVPVRTLGSILEFAIQPAMIGEYSHIPAPDWKANTPLNLLCLQVYLRLCSQDKHFRSPLSIVEQIDSLCRSNVLFAKDGEASILPVSITEFDEILKIVLNVASKYCCQSQEYLSIIIESTHAIRHDSLQGALRTASAIKSSKPHERLKLEHDFRSFCTSMDHACLIVRRLFEYLKGYATRKSLQGVVQFKFYRAEAQLHALNLCRSASEIISFVELHQKPLNQRLATVIDHLQHFLKVKVAWHNGKFKTLYDDINRNQEFCSLILSIVVLPAFKFDTFQNDLFDCRIRMQESLLSINDHYLTLLVKLHRLECIICASQSMIASHFGSDDAMRYKMQLPAIMASFPPIFVAQFKLMWSGIFNTYNDFINEQFHLTKKDKLEIPALKLLHFTDFMASIQHGSVRSWLETVTGEVMPARFLTIGGDVRLRPLVLSHFFLSLVKSPSDPSMDVLNVATHILPLCAPVSSLSNPSDVSS
jgi:hypothetical protein